ncbi:hypothetical protein Gpo141_00015121, partial [Globisporangium polare]
TRANVCTFSHDALVRCHPSQLDAMIAATYTTSWRASLSPPPSTTECTLSQVSSLKRQRDESQLTFTAETTTVTKKAKQLCLETIDVEHLFDGLPTGSPLVLLDAVDVSDLLALDWAHAAAVGGIGEDAAQQLQLQPRTLSFDFECDGDGDDLAAFDLAAFIDFGDEELIATTNDELLLMDDILGDSEVSLLELELDF